MKQYLLFYILGVNVTFYESDSLEFLNAKVHQLNLDSSLCVLCKLVEGYYIPAGKVGPVYILVPDLLKELHKIMDLYTIAKSNLPRHFPYSNQLS